MSEVFKLVKEFKKKFPLTVAFRTRKHSKIIDMHLNPNEKLLYVFCGQKNVSSLMFINSPFVGFEK